MIPYKILEVSSSSDPTNAVLFVGICLVLGIACRHLLRGTKVPYTVALLVLGIALGSLEYGTGNHLGKIGNGIRLWENIDPDLLLAVFLPPLLFEGSFAMEVHEIKKCMVQMLLLAGPGVFISTFCLGSALKFTFPYEWSWKTSLLLGGILSATDPVAVVAVLNELDACKKLNTIIEGESMMNDGVAIVVYQLFYRMILGSSFSWGGIVKFLIQASVGAVAIGLAFGISSLLFLGFVFNDTVIATSLTVAVSYVAYFTAQQGADVSGVLTVTTLGMFYAAVAKLVFKEDGQQSLHYCWEMLVYLANTVVFILSGVIIAEGVLSSGNIEGHVNSWGYLILLYIYVHLSRCVVVGVLYPFLRYFGYGLDWKEATILTWSGLRGPVALSLSLSVKGASSRSSYLSLETGTLFVFFTGGIVFLTLIVNGSTAQYILHLLDMDKLSVAKKCTLDYTKYEILNKALGAFAELGDDEELGPADWPTVKRFIASLNNVEGGSEFGNNEELEPADWPTIKRHIAILNNVEGSSARHHSVSKNEIMLDLKNIRDIRICLLNGVQAAYQGMLDERRIRKTTADFLIRSVVEAIELISHEPLCDWKGLKANVFFPNQYKFLLTSICSQNLLTNFMVERLESGCNICAAFLRAHRIARRHLHGLIGNSEIASVVINESEVEGVEARKFLDDVRITFPQVLRVVKIRQVTYSVLKHLIHCLQNLEKVWLLQENEMLDLDEAIRTDFKNVLKYPPLVKMLKTSDLIDTHPLLGALPSKIREPLVDSNKETKKLYGVTLYSEGSKPNGIWLISNGVVKWSSRSLNKTHALHLTFIHGSTLGLYETLTGKPYICDTITDSVVLCFFVESEKILSMLRLDTAVEDFLWKESVIVVARLLLPQIFENMAMQKLRAILAEGSMMTIYRREETIEIPDHSIGFLLEGSVKYKGAQGELIASPAALLPPYGNQTFQNLQSSAILSQQGSSYTVVERARVISLVMAASEAESPLQRKSLMPSCGGTGFSDRAMQISIFGTVVDKRGWNGGFRRNIQEFVQSEGTSSFGQLRTPFLQSGSMEHGHTSGRMADSVGDWC